MSKSIYEIKDDFKAFEKICFELQETLEDEGRNISDEEKKLIQEFYAENNQALDSKLENTAKFIANLKGEAAMLDEELKRLQKRKKAAENLSETLKFNLDFILKKLGIKDRKVGIFKFAIQKNAPTLIIDNPDLVPDDYKTAIINIDKTKIKNDLKDGMKLPDGACHFEQSESLRIR